MLRKLLTAVGGAVARRPGTVLAGIVLLTAGALPFAIRTVNPANIEKDLLQVLTAGFPRAEAYKRLATDFGVTDRHFVLVEMDDPADLPAAKRFADRLAEGLGAEEKLVVSARSRMELAGFLRENAHLFLDEEIAAKLAARTTDEALLAAMKRNRELIRVSSEMKERVLLDPLGLVEVLREVARGRAGGESAPVDLEGYVLSPDGKTLMVSAQPTVPAAQGETGGFTDRLLAATDRAISSARAECFADDPRTGSRIRTRVGGSYAALKEGGQLIIAGVLKSALTSFVGVLLLFSLVYRRPSAFFFIGLPLTVPVIWTLGLVPLGLPEYGGRLSAVGGTFAAVLLGLGIDYAVHLYNRFVAERAGGATPGESAERSILDTGEAIICGALTTVIAFAGMTFTSFRGFREFGRLAGLGVLLTAIVLLVGLPAALAILARLRGSRAAPQPFSFGLAAAARLVRRRPGTLLAVWLLGFAVAVAAMFPIFSPQWGVYFELDLGKLGPPKHMEEVGQVNRDAAEAFNLDYREISVVVRGRDCAEVMERTAEMCGRARKCDLIRSVRGVLDLLPAPSAQRRSMELVEELKFDELPARLDKAAVKVGFSPGVFRRCAFSKFAGGMAARAAGGKVLDPAELACSGAPELSGVRELLGYVFLRPSGDVKVFRTHTRLSVKSDRGRKGLKSHHYRQLGEEIGVDRENVTMTSYMLVVYELKDSVKKDLAIAISAVSAAVLVTLLLTLRRPVYVLTAISPVLIGGALMMLVMKLTGLYLNYISMLVFPVLIGIGVDNAVHLVIRFRQENLDAGAAVMETGRALVVCSLTTILGFMSLLTCPHWGLRSLGITVGIGMTFVMTCSVLFVPAVLELVARRAKRK
jgi:predicted RND superfamily exporter protein